MYFSNLEAVGYYLLENEIKLVKYIVPRILNKNQSTLECIGFA